MPRERLSPLDASFLYLDGALTCNQGVGLNVVDGPIDFGRVLDEMQRKVRYVDRMRQCAVFSPLNLFHPTWEFDPHFEIRNHVKHIVIEPTGEKDRYWDAISTIFRTKLDRAHPLWAVYVIEGAPDGKSAYVIVMHHCVSDGIGFAKLALALYDADRTLQLDPWEPPQERPWPSPVARLAYGLLDAVCATPAALLQLWNGARVFMDGFLRAKGKSARRLLREFRRAPGVRFPFNAPLSGDAAFAYARFRLDDISFVRSMLGGTLNDVLLAIVGTAMHRYADDHGIVTEDRFLRVLVPSNIRTSDTEHNFGNFVSMAPVLVPLGNMPTRDRLAAVVRYTKEMKECGLAQTVSIGIALSQWILSPPISYLAHRLFSSRWMQRREARSRKTPRFNVVVTNVPGSPHPSYVAGQELCDVFVLVPLLRSVGLCCGALSHHGTLFVTFSGDKATVPDVESLSDYLNGAFAELMREAPSARPEPAASARVP